MLLTLRRVTTSGVPVPNNVRGISNGSTSASAAAATGETEGDQQFHWAVEVVDRRHNHGPDKDQHLPVRYTKEEEDEIIRLEAQGATVDQIFLALNQKRQSEGERVISSSRALRSKLNKLVKARTGGGGGDTSQTSQQGDSQIDPLL